MLNAELHSLNSALGQTVGDTRYRTDEQILHETNSTDDDEGKDMKTYKATTVAGLKRFHSRTAWSVSVTETCNETKSVTTKYL